MTVKFVTTAVVMVVVLGTIAALRYAVIRDQTSVSISPDPRLGLASASVQIIEYSDFQCPVCQKLQEQFLQAKQEFGDQMSIVYNNFPLTQLHPNSFAAAVAGECAFRQAAFWPFHDRLFEQQTDWSVAADPTDLFLQYAAELEMDSQSFQSCLTAEDTAALVQEDMREGEQANISSTPTLFINGERLTGVGSYGTLQAAINRQLTS